MLGAYWCYVTMLFISGMFKIIIVKYIYIWVLNLERLYSFGNVVVVFGIILK